MVPHPCVKIISALLHATLVALPHCTRHGANEALHFSPISVVPHQFRKIMSVLLDTTIAALDDFDLVSSAFPTTS